MGAESLAETQLSALIGGQSQQTLHKRHFSTEFNKVAPQICKAEGSGFALRKTAGSGSSLRGTAGSGSTILYVVPEVHMAGDGEELRHLGEAVAPEGDVPRLRGHLMTSLLVRLMKYFICLTN